MALQNFVDFLPPSVKAAWLNAVDALKFTVFNDAATKAAARTAIELDAQLIAEGVDTGAVNAAVVTLIGPVTGFNRVVGTKVSFVPATTNTGATTLNVNDTGVAAVLAQDGTPCTGGELFLPVTVEWTGSAWRIIAGGIPLANRRTAAENTAAVVPASYLYPPANILRYGADPTGVASSQSALTAARAVAGATVTTPIEILFPAGTYRYATSPDWALSNLCLRASGRVILQHEGSGLAWRFGADAATSYYLNVTMEGDFVISGNANTSVGLRTQHLHHSNIKAEIRNCTGTGAEVHGSVLSRFDIAVTINRGAMNWVPEDGLEIYGTAQIAQTTACEFYVILEGVTVNGLILVGAAGNRFTGTSEGNGARGVYIDVDSPGNSFETFFMEDNDAGDIYCLSDSNQFVNCTANSRAPVPPYDSVKSVVFDDTASKNQWLGGGFYTMVIEATCADTVALWFNSDNQVENSGVRTWLWGQQDFVSATPQPAQIPLVSTWTNLTLQNAWTHQSGAYNVPQYIRNYSTGEVSVRGNIGGGVTGTTMFTLPVEARPSLARACIVPAANADDYAILQVNTDGTVVHVQGYTASLVLDQLRFIE